MRNGKAIVLSMSLAAAFSLVAASGLAQSVQPQDIGVVQAPSAGNRAVNAPADILHSAEVAMKKYDDGATVISSHLDKDDVMGIWEVQGRTAAGRLIEVDVRPGGTIEEVELEIGAGQVPPEVQAALARFAPGFIPSPERPRIEKSVRPSAIGLPEVWYEFSGTTFDVEIRSDGRAVFIEPA
jgi:hypothetical protein